MNVVILHAGMGQTYGNGKVVLFAASDHHECLCLQPHEISYSPVSPHQTGNTLPPPCSEPTAGDKHPLTCFGTSYGWHFQNNAHTKGQQRNVIGQT